MDSLVDADSGFAKGCGGIPSLVPHECKTDPARQPPLRVARLGLQAGGACNRLTLPKSTKEYTLLPEG